jgi:hypothetical protein
MFAYLNCSSIRLHLPTPKPRAVVCNPAPVSDHVTDISITIGQVYIFFFEFLTVGDHTPAYGFLSWFESWQKRVGRAKLKKDC